MNASDRRPWVLRAILLGVVYLVVGLVFGALANSSASQHGRFLWRLAAWVASAAVYAAHIGYEHFRLANPPRTTALHAAAAAAVGAFVLAAAANVHGVWVAASHQRLLRLSLVAWPALVALPAFVVALVAAFGLAVIRRRAAS